MKVLDLQCGLGHRFEGWFGSEAEYQQQHADGLLSCPVCGSVQIDKCLSAPRLNLGAPRPAGDSLGDDAQGASSRRGKPAADNTAPNEAATPLALANALREAGGDLNPAMVQAAWREMGRRVKANSQDVGDRFAQEARKIHEGEAPERAIHGKASLQEARELLEDGIGVMPLPPDDDAGPQGPLH